MGKKASDDRVRAELRDVFDAVAHRTTATATRSALAATPATETTPLRRWDRDPAEDRARWMVLVAAVAALVLLVGFLAVRATRDDAAISTIDSRPQPSEYPTTPVPTGWQTLDFGDLRLSVPGDWAVTHQPDRGSGGGCPTATPTLVLGGGGSGPCPTPSSPPRLVSLARFAGDCDNKACGERSGSGAVRPDLPITKFDIVHSLRVASSDHYGEQCDTCLTVVFPDLGVLAHFTRIDQATASSILDTIDRSSRWRALHEGPLAATDNWQIVDAAGATKMSAPDDWPIVRVSENTSATVPWQCIDGFAQSNARTVIVDDRPAAKPSCTEMTVGSVVDALYIRPSQQVAYDYDLSPGDSTSSNGVTVTVLDDIYPGTSTIELRIERPGAPAARASIGVSQNPVIARTILQALGRASTPNTTHDPSTTSGTGRPHPTSSPSPSTAATANTVPVRGWRRLAAWPEAGDLGLNGIGREGFTAVAAGSEVIVWGGKADGRDANADGAVLDVASNTWRTLPPAPLAARFGHVAVWTGHEMLLWGGTDQGTSGQPMSDGAAYSPVTNTWRPIAPSPLHGGSGYKAVWTGNEMVVVGGIGGDSTGDGQQPSIRRNESASYNPATDTWQQLPDMPIDLSFLDLHWTGNDVVAVGGQSFNDGNGAINKRGPVMAAALDPATRTWKATPQAPLPSQSIAEAWTGDELLVVTYQSASDGSASWNPNTEEWTSRDSIPARSCEDTPTAVAITDGAVAGVCGTVARYDRNTHTWTVLDVALPDGTTASLHQGSTVFTGDTVVSIAGDGSVTAWTP